jgi:hypothetical protein
MAAVPFFVLGGVHMLREQRIRKEQTQYGPTKLKKMHVSGSYT